MLPEMQCMFDECVRLEADIARFARRRLIPQIIRPKMWKSRLFREWWRVPMNYARCIELPLTQLLLDASPDDTLLDISSPKLMALYQASHGYHHVTAADIAPQFAEDLQMICSALGVELQTRVFDAKSIPYPDESFSRIYSISVIEHIPGEGDRIALSEISRVLTNSGRFVMTLPAYPQYLEEWLSRYFGWNSFSETRADGRCFYQRRYDPHTLRERFKDTGLQFEKVIFIAEQPLEPVHIRDDGMLSHNSSQVESQYRRSKIRRATSFLPHQRYHYESRNSHRLRYLTRDESDPQIRQVAVTMTKT